MLVILFEGEYKTSGCYAYKKDAKSKYKGIAYYGTKNGNKTNNLKSPKIQLNVKKAEEFILKNFCILSRNSLTSKIKWFIFDSFKYYFFRLELLLDHF